MAKYKRFMSIYSTGYVAEKEYQSVFKHCSIAANVDAKNARKHLARCYRNAVERYNQNIQDSSVNGFVYCLLAKEVNLCKIGFATNRAGGRTKLIHSHCPYNLELHSIREAIGGMVMESQIHKDLKRLGQHFNREWFIWSDITRQYMESL